MIYSQSKGMFLDDSGNLIQAGCYAGNGNSKNNPADQNLEAHGPLPCGSYTISPIHVVPHLGPCCALTPAPTNQMFGRSGFFIHLDNPAHVGDSSDGCIVAPNYMALVVIAAHGPTLEVVQV